jgi:membrane protein YdbS with pleckstrin-like domain
MWRLQLGGVAAAVAVAAVLVLGPWGAVAVPLGAAATWVLPQVRHRRWRYEVREEELDLRHGLWTVARTLVPIRRVQHVDTESGPLQSAFDLATVTFHTAAGKTRIPAVTRGEAEAIRRRVAELARTRDDV